MAQYKKVGNLKVRTDLSPEKQALVNQIAKNYVNEQKAINKSYLKDMARMVGGTALSGASFLPVLNIPGAGAAVGGAMYDLGQGIVEGDKARDLVKRAARGAAIGAVIPPAAKKIAATKAGQAVGKQLTKVAEKAAQNPTVQKAYDALMTDIRAFNPNKQTAYHGSPYDFEKFSNEAIGTGEGAQAHGYGHYAALNKDVAEEYASRLSKNPLANEEYLNSTELKNLSDSTKQNLGLWDKDFTEQMLKEDLSYSKNWLEEQRLKGKLTPEQESGTLATIDKYQKDLDLLKNFDDSNLTSNKQLYKLSVPKDDVMLREGATFAEQPKQVQQMYRQSVRDQLLNRQKEIKESKDFLLNELEEAKRKGSDRLIYSTEQMINESMPQYNQWSNDIAKQLKNLDNKDYFDNLDYRGLLFNLLPENKLRTGLKLTGEESKVISEALNKAGIKGISYNGGIDGEARVIFNPDDIVIGRKYYNQPTLKDIYNKFINSGAIADAITNP